MEVPGAFTSVGEPVVLPVIAGRTIHEDVLIGEEGGSEVVFARAEAGADETLIAQ